MRRNFCWSPRKVDNTSEMWWICIINVKVTIWKKKKSTTKVYCDDGWMEVLFMDVSLHSMCHSLSVGRGDGVGMSIITGVALKDKVRHSLQGHTVLGLMCYFIALYRVWMNERAAQTVKRKERKLMSVSNNLPFPVLHLGRDTWCVLLCKTFGTNTLLHVSCTSEEH